METIVEVQNLKKKFNKTEILKGISFHINEGEIVGFIGPNGAGKTTTMKCLCNLIFANSGSIQIAGFDLSKERDNALAAQASLIEYPGLFPYMKGIDNLKVFAALRGVSHTRIEEIIDFMNLSKKDLQKKVEKYSLGMKQRLGLGVALLAKPKFLMLDEPTNGLDPSAVIELRKTIKYLAEVEKTAILFSSHSLGEIEKVAHRIICINKGEIVPTPTLLNNGIPYEFVLDKTITLNEYTMLPFVKSAQKDQHTDIVILEKDEDLQLLLNYIHEEKQCNILEFSKVKIDVEELYKEIYGA